MPQCLKKLAAITLFSTVLVFGAAFEAPAHEESHALAGATKLSMSDPGGRPEKRKFLFKATKQLGINDVAADPSQALANFTVYGQGAAAGDSGVVYLDAGPYDKSTKVGWKRIGKASDPKGWLYKSDWRQSSLGGISKVLIKKGSKGGKLLIKAKGEFWPYRIDGAHDSVRVSAAIGDELYCVEFSPAGSQFKKNQAGKIVAKLSSAPESCDAVCGNGRLELSEQCDDGNTEGGDTCGADCSSACGAGTASYDSTFAGIQDLIFDSEVLACSNDVCHGAAGQGGLDLRSGISYGELLSVPSQAAPSTVRIFPGDQDLSMLYLKMAAKTLATPGVPGSPMPANASVLSEDLLEAVRLWIRAGAGDDTVVAGTAELLDSCLPPPGPNKMPQPEVPPAGHGLQVAQPGYQLPAQSETELCIASFYDLTASGAVADQYRVPCPAGKFSGTNPGGQCVAFNKTLIAQDSQSHHSILHVYGGQYDETHAGWGGWLCYGGDNSGSACNPASAQACPGDGVCGSAAVPGFACTGYGPPDLLSSSSRVALTQEPTFTSQLSTGVYDLIPLRGIVVWNSHAFNLTGQDTNLHGWFNIEFTADQQYASREYFDLRFIYTQNVPPYQQREYCATYTFPNNSHIIELNSHTHQWGKRFRIYGPPQQACSGQGGGTTSAGCLPGSATDLIYESFDYSDPLVLRWGDQYAAPYDTPLLFSGTQAARTIKFCALYDNGFTDPGEIKRQSTSVVPQVGGAGGPCSDSQAKCLGGSNAGASCFGNDAVCPGGLCDACNVRGGSTTTDEMLIPFARYFVAP